jgi:tetratricopeptide (TPR) repeat protein
MRSTVKGPRMIGRLRGRKAWIALVAVGVAAGVSIAVWLIRRPPLPEIPRPDPAAFVDQEVRQDISEAARKVESEPRSAAAWGDYGIVLRAYRQHPEADVCFQTAADLDPTDGRWPYLVGHYRVETDPESAVGWLRRAAAGTVPADAQDTVQARLAEALLAAGRPAEALTALGSDPKSPRARLAAARAATATGDDRAAAEFLVGLTDHPAAARQALLLRAEICRRQGRTSYADYLGDRAAALPEVSWPDPLSDPIASRDHSPGGRLDEAARLLRAGRPDQAEQLLRPLTTNPAAATDARPFVGLAEARAAKGDRTGALSALADARRVDPNNLAANYQTGFLHFDTGEYLWANGRTDAARNEFREAVTWLDKTLTLSPDFGKALLLKGAALHRFLGRPDEGLAILRRFVQLRPESGEGHLLLGQSLAESGQITAATASLRRAAELAPSGDHRAVDALAKLAPPGKR